MSKITRSIFLFRAIYIWGILAFMCCNVKAQTNRTDKSTFSSITGKKLIEYGWDVPRADYVLEHLDEMEELPFEGVIFRLEDGGNIFLVKKPPLGISTENEKTLRALKSKWGKFTDNFIAMYAQSDMDWQNDKDWSKITKRVSEYARAAKISGCVGLLFDPEPYGASPWDYRSQKNVSHLSFEEYSELVCQRGRQFMNAMTKEFPNIKLLMFFQYKRFYAAAHQPDPTVRKAALQAYHWNLLLPFLNGMLEEANGNVQLIDGNEPSYYYKSALDFYHAYWVMHQGAKINVPDALKRKYDTNVSAANALYMDYIFDKQGLGHNPASGMTDEERAKWFQHNVYYALKTSDEYVWLYSERMDWWKHVTWPPGIKQAIITAKQKLMHGEKLGYDMDSTFVAAQARLSQMLQERLIRRKANIPKIEPQQVLTIDGKLDEEIYEQIPWSDAFVTLVSPKEKQQAPVTTRAWLAYDQENLYLAFRCEEPDMAQQNVVDVPRDGAIWNGENVDFSILKPGQEVGSPAAKYYHFILNPANIQWDSLDSGKQSNTAFNADWKSATSRDSKGWSAEIALSWESIGITNVKEGMQLQGNLARFRVVDRETTPSSWSQFIAGFQEPENFGTFILK